MLRKNNKGFSLIELIVVIAIIGILVMLAAPRFIGFVEKAEVARIQNDLKVMEGKIAEEYINSDYKFDGDIAKADMVGDKTVYGTEGIVDISEIEDVSYKVVEPGLVEDSGTKLNGDFYVDAEGKVYYVDNKANTGDNNTPEGGDILDAKGCPVDGYVPVLTEKAQLPIVEDGKNIFELIDDYPSLVNASYSVYEKDEEYYVYIENYDNMVEQNIRFEEYYFAEDDNITELFNRRDRADLLENKYSYEFKVFENDVIVEGNKKGTLGFPEYKVSYKENGDIETCDKIIIGNEIYLFIFENLIGEAESLNPNDFIDFTEVENALDNAINVRDDENATQEDIINAITDLEDALNNLELKPDKSNLIDKIDEAKALIPEDYIDFTGVENAIINAETVRDDQTATQNEVDTAADNLEEAIYDLDIPLNVPNGYTVATNDDFEWVSFSYGNAYTARNENGRGYYKYVGDDEYVVIPNKINGNLMTSYYFMFKNSDETLKGVASNNPNITSMKHMFYESLASSLDLSNLNTSNVTTMLGMFRSSSVNTLDLTDWNTANVISMGYMFADIPATSLNVSGLDTSKVRSMSSMFNGSQATTIDLTGWNTSNVTNMSWMFSNSQVTSLDLSGWNTSNVTNMNGMFSMSQATTIDLSGWNTSNVTDMRTMFYNSQATLLDLSSFDTSNNIDMKDMFMASSVNTGYAKTQADADRFNASSNKPSGLTFTVK
jgi:prepilin-type N-terminal cleavage/methylation domain-containing protein